MQHFLIRRGLYVVLMLVPGQGARHRPALTSPHDTYL